MESPVVLANEKSYESYDFQIPSIIEKAVKGHVGHVGLQFPEGFLEYGTLIARQISQGADCDVTIMADAVFGACCVDDLACRSMGIDLLVHFGHSCLIPVDQTVVQTMYIAVTMKFDHEHLIDTIRYNFPCETKIALQGTIQFTNCLPLVMSALVDVGYISVQIPRSRPLGPGETLGCTSPEITGADVLIFVADGRFHIEAAMMANPDLPAFRYDPFSCRFFSEFLSVNELKKVREIEMKKCMHAKRVGLILGTLGRQGSVGVLESLKELLIERNIAWVVVLLSEISPNKLNQFEKSVDCWVQVACPRLSIDWGESYNVPMLTSFEAFQIWSNNSFELESIPMDYYSNSAGPWGNYAHKTTQWKFYHMGPGKNTLAPINRA